MGRVTPDPPSRLNGLHDVAICEYCGRYGLLGSCAGCGAPNKPAPQFDNDLNDMLEEISAEVEEAFARIPARRPDMVLK